METENKNENLGVVHIGKGKDTLSAVPAAPKYLTTVAKKYYSVMGQMLASKDRLKDIYLNALEIYAVAMEQWVWSCKAIQIKNSKKPGSGYIQKYSTGATNISTEIVLRNDAADTLLKCFKQFGLDPKSEKELKEAVDKGQFDLFEEYAKLKNGTEK